jgi:hypothetical protein
VLGATAGTLGAMSGCFGLDFSNEAPSVRLSELVLANARQQPHTVAVTVEQDGEVVYDETVIVDAGNGDVAAERTITGPWTQETGRYTLTAALDGTTIRRSSDEEYRRHETNTDEPCFSVVVLLTKSIKIEQLWQVTEDC